MNISAWSVRRPIPVIVMFLVLTLAGLLAFGRLGIDLNPNVDFPVVTVSVAQVGAAPEEMEKQVTKKIEDAVAGLGNIDKITSTVRDGSSTTSIAFLLGTNIDRATNDVRDAVTRIRQDLPGGIQEPVVQRLEFGGGVIMTYAVNSDRRSVEELSDLVDRTISQEILTVKGVARVARVGGVDPEIRLDLDPQQLDALGITATQVNDQVRALNVNLPSGRANLGNQEQSFRTLGSASTLEALRSYRIALPQGGTVPLSSLGKVERSYREARQSAYFNNQPVVAFSIYRSTGSTLVAVEDGVKTALERLAQTLPKDISTDLIFTRADDIRESYLASIEDLILGCALAVVVVGLFLRDWRSTIITSMALPLSIIPTFLVLQWFGYTLNSMTLLALTLAIGNLVDDAIVEIENVERHSRMGKSPYQATLDSTAEVGLAVLASTATIVVVFLPVAFMGGIPGQFFKPFGLTVAVATIFSILVARLVTPIMAAYWLKPKPETMAESELVQGPGFYRAMLSWALRHRGVTLALAVIFFVGSLQLVPYIPTNLFDRSDTGLSTLALELPPGSTLKDTETAANRLTQLLKQDRVVATVLSLAGGEEVNQATLYVRLVAKGDRTLSQWQFQDQARNLFQQVPGARISFKSQGATGDGKDLTVVLKGENPDGLSQAADTLSREMRSIPGLVDVSSSASLVKPEVQIIPDRDRAADLGVTVQSIARTAALATLGDSDANLADFNLGDRQIPIRVQIDPIFRDDPKILQTLRVPGQNGELIPLAAVAQVNFSSGPAQLDRVDRSRQVTLGANLQGLTLGQGLAAVSQLPAMKTLPSGVTQQPAGDGEIMKEIFGRFALALATAILLIYAVLVLLYNNFMHPITVMAALPLSIGGALLGLLVTQKPMGLYALIGIVLLMGLVTKNSILLVDYALTAQQEGLGRKAAAINAGVTRLRPILMTSVSTVAGMLPLAMELGAGGETRSPMAISVIGGFTTSTLLTLVVVPVLFTYIDQINSFLDRRLNRSPQPPGPITPEPKAETPASPYTLIKYLD